MNMAVDEAILHAVADGDSPPTLRFYGWNPACLSLGRAQPIADVAEERILANGWDLVRRPTGGRAILHQNELTYAVVASEDHPLMKGGVLESYRRISQALTRGLEIMGIPVEVETPQENPEHDRSNPICFEVPSAYEITVDGKKIIGSAQVRKRKTVLQHGSLPLAGDLGQTCDVLSFLDDDSREQARRDLLQRASTLESLLGKQISWNQLVGTMVRGFERAHDLSFSRLDLTQGELQRVGSLLESRYENPIWTAQKPNGHADTDS